MNLQKKGEGRLRSGEEVVKKKPEEFESFSEKKENVQVKIKQKKRADIQEELEMLKLILTTCFINV